MARGQGHIHHVSHSTMMQPHGGRGGVIFLPRCRNCSESLPTNQSLVMTTEKLYPLAGSRSWLFRDLHEPALGNVLPLQQPRTWWKLRQPITFEEV
jgi:hypothetical protein